MRLFLIVGVLAMTSGWCAGQDDEAEELPNPEPYRQTMRHSFNRGGGGVSGGGGGSGSKPSASYDLSKTFDSMIRKNAAADSRMGGDYGGNSRLDMGLNDDTISRDDYYEPYPSESGYGGGGGGYGGYGSESGYGLSCASGYVNASAVALLAFLFLLNIVQDIVQQIQARKRRDADEENDIFAFIHNRGLSTLKAGLPEVVLPLMVDLMEAQEAPHCLQRPLCEANLKLASNYGIVGKVVASLLSNVVGKAFSGDDAHKFHLGLQAASVGRSKGNCSSLFRSCGGLSYLHDIRDGVQENDGDLRQTYYQKDSERVDNNYVH